MVEQSLLAGTLTMPLMLIVSYALAVLTTRYGLDPDDHSVPVVTSVMDVTGITAFLLAMTILGVGVR